MDSSRKFMGNFDSLWFFNNVLTLSTFQQKIHPPEIVKEEEQFKPKAQNLETEAPSAGISLQRLCPNSGEIEQPVKEIESEKPIATERGKRRRRRKRSKRKILGELDLGFHGDRLLSEETYVCDGSFETQQYYAKMPPLNDGLAMKEHLKSWAYAVACRVR